jgi:uncharacterized protein (TIGR00255 family)
MRSMTGYGTQFEEQGERTVSVEIRSGNHRFLDLHVRLPREYAFLEVEIAQLLRASLSRGRVDLYASVQAPVLADSLLDLRTGRLYVEAAARLRDEFQLKDTLDLRTLLGLPGVLRSREAPVPSQAQGETASVQLILECVRKALKNLVEMRNREGQALASEMTERLGRIRESVGVICGLAPRAVEEQQRKLLERLRTLLPDAAIEPQRLAQEVALLAEKADITEELARLDSHLQQCERLVDSATPAGKELDFLMQELHREINTVLSKTTDIAITRSGLAVKAEIEKLREQVQNIE